MKHAGAENKQRPPLLLLGKASTNNLANKPQQGHGGDGVGGPASCFPFELPPLMFVSCGVERGFNPEMPSSFLTTSKWSESKGAGGDGGKAEVNDEPRHLRSRPPQFSPTSPRNTNRLSVNPSFSSASFANHHGVLTDSLIVEGVVLDAQGWHQGVFRNHAERDAVLAQFKGA
jgi:hypothetical protein